MTGKTRPQTIAELQTAADHACKNGDYQTAIALITEALRQNHLTGEQQCELLKRRAAVYELVADTAAQIADLQAANQLLSQQLDDHDTELILLNSIAQALTEQHDIQAIYDLVGDKLREIFKADATFIAFHDDEKINIIAPYYRDNNSKQTLIRPYSVRGIYHSAVETGQPHLAGTQEEARKLGIYPVASPGAERDLNESLIVVPIIKDGRSIGATSVQSYKQYAYDESDVRLLTTLTNSMSVALENARLFDETQRLLKETEERNAELAVINSIQQGIAAELDFQGIVDLVGDELRRQFNEADIGIYWYNQQANLVEYLYLYEHGERVSILARPPEPDGVMETLIKTRRPLVLNNQADLEAFGMKALPGTKAGKGLASVPIIGRDRVLGGIGLENFERENAFGAAELRLLTTVAHSMGTALENARLFDETQRLLKETEQRNAELGIINSVQEGLAMQLDFQGIVELIGVKVGGIFAADTTEVYMYDVKRDWISNTYYVDRGERISFPDRPARRPSLGLTVLDTRKPLLLGTSEEANSFGAIRVPRVGAEVDENESYLGVPILTGNKPIGLINVQSYKQNAYSQDDLRLLQTLANSMSVALENARLFDETQRLLKETEQRNAELAVINSIQQGIAAELDFQGIVDLVGDDALRDLFNEVGIGIYWYDQEANLVEYLYLNENGERMTLPARPPEPDGVMETLIKTRQPLILNNQTDLETYARKVLPDTRAGKALASVPIIGRDRVLGGIWLENFERENAFGAAELRLLTTIAHSMGTALENARLFNETQRLLKETEQRNAELAIINSVQQGLAAELNMQAIYDLVGNQIRDIFACQSVVIVGIDQAHERAEFHYVYENNERFYPTPVPITDLPTGQLMLRDPKPIKLDTEAAFKALNLQTIEGTQQRSKSGLFVPLLVGNEVRWGISLQNLEQENAFSDADLRLLTTLANSMSVAVENARLFAETQHHAREMAALTEVGQDISATLDLPTVLERIGSHARELLTGSDSAVFLLDETEQNMQALVAQGPIAAAVKMYAVQPGEGILGDVWQRGEAEIINAANKDPRARQIPGTAVQSEEKMMVVPLLAGRHVTGLMAVWRSEGNLFHEIDLRFLEGLARQAAIAIENARLFDETQRLLEETQQRNAELAVINSVQQGLVAELDMQAIYDLVGEQIRDIFDAQVVTLNRFDHAMGRNIYCCAFERGERLFIKPQPFTPIIDNFIREGQPLLLNEGVERFMLEGGATIAAGEMPRSFLAVPLWSGNQVSGSITLQDVDHEHAFTEADLRLLSTLAASTSVALESARLYSEMEAARAAAVRANESKSAFLANVSHELRTPLTSILGFTRIVQKRLDERISPHVPGDDGRAQRALKQVEENLNIVLGEGERLTTLINNVLDLEKIEAGQVEWHMERLSVADVIERGLQATAAIVEQVGLTLEREVSAGLPPINGDRDKLVQVVINLIANAVKFTATGKITCRAALVDGEIQMSIQDTGVGIAAADLETVFEKFKQVGDTLTDKPTGTGLGLPICKEIVEQHNGRIWAESVLGQGSTFTFALPAWRETA